MNRNEALERALEFKEISEKCDEVSFIDRDTEFFEYVIKELTAQEVPVQEQSVININLDENFTKEVVEKISELNKLLDQEPKIITYQKI